MSTVFKRKFRWTVEWRDQKTWQLIAPESFVKVSARPSPTVEETELNYLNSTNFIAGKRDWQDITITYYDVENDEGGALFFRWLGEQWKLNEPKEEGKSHSIAFEPACVILRLYDGCGVCMELWYLENSLVTAFDFGELSYGTDCEVNVKIKYMEADYVHPEPGQWLKPLPATTPCVPGSMGIGALGSSHIVF